MKEQLTQPTTNQPATAGIFDRFATLDRLGRYITLTRLLLAVMAATAFWDISSGGALLVFTFVFMIPIPSAFDVRLSSGRLVRQVVVKSFFTLPSLQRMLEVRYEACTDDHRSMDFLREEVEVCTAVMEECEQLEIESTDIIAVLPSKVNDFNIERSSSKNFVKVNGRWVDSSS